MHKYLIGLLAAVSASAASATVEIDFNSATGDIGTSHTYSGGGLSVTANGLGPTGAIDLFGKNNGGDESGVGIANDPTGDHEIWGDATTPNFGAIVLNVSDLLAHNVSGAQFFMGSTTNGESWIVWDNSGGGFAQVLTGADELTWHNLPDWGSATEYAFSAGGAGQNVLLGGISLTALPEPATWAMMLLGFGAIGVALRRRKKVLPQIA